LVCLPTMRLCMLIAWQSQTPGTFTLDNTQHSISLVLLSTCWSG